MNTIDRLPPFSRTYDHGHHAYSSRVVFLEQWPAALTPPTHPAEPWNPGPDDYLDAYHRVGNPWLWYGRLEMGGARIAADLADSARQCWRIDADGGFAGFCELVHRSPLDAEILHFGLIPAVRGQGLGGRLMRTALAGALSMGARRVWLHTCSEDSAEAVGFYQHAGFRIFGTRLEWVTDPRRRGLLPATAGEGTRLPWSGEAAAASSEAGDAGSGVARPGGSRQG